VAPRVALSPPRGRPPHSFAVSHRKPDGTLPTSGGTIRMVVDDLERRGLAARVRRETDRHAFLARTTRPQRAPPSRAPLRAPDPVALARPHRRLGLRDEGAARASTGPASGGRPCPGRGPAGAGVAVRSGI